MIPEIGPRQTVDRAKHPTLGEGRVVFDNGPMFFLSDDGQVEHYKSEAGCGARSEPRYSYKTMRRADGVSVELETTGRVHGDRHWRAFVRMLGAGWLVQIGNAPPRSMPVRFEPDDGKPITLDVHSMWTGLPKHDFEKKQTKAMEAEREAASDAGWFTYRSDEGEFVWCHERDTEKAQAWLKHRHDPKPEKPKRGKKAPSGPLPDFANMTREQIKQWEQGASSGG